MSVDRVTWLEERRRGVGASDVAGIVGRSPWQTPWTIWAAKVGLTELDSAPTESQAFGRRLEPVLADAFTDQTGLWVAAEQLVVNVPATPWFATLDGLVLESHESDIADALGVFEAKFTAQPPWDEVPDHYHCQVQWQMMVTDLPRAWLAVYHVAFGRPSFRVYEVERDQAEIEALVAMVERFWTRYVLTGEPPPPDAHPATTEAIGEAFAEPDPDADAVDLEALAGDVAELQNYRAMLKALRRDVELRENTIKARLGKATEGHIGGELICSWREQHRKEHTVPAGSFRVFRLHA